MEVAVTGDFGAGDVMRALADAFGGWSSPVPFERIEEPYLSPDPGTESIHTPGQLMAILSLGTALELGRDHPDFAALKLASYIFAEKSRARIDERLRHTEGLSYHVNGAYEADDFEQSSYLYAYAFCAPENLEEARAALEDEYRNWIDGGVSQEEIDEARAMLADEFALNLGKGSYVAREMARGLTVGRCFGGIFQFQERLETLTADEVNRALERHFGNAPRVLILVGDGAA